MGEALLVRRQGGKRLPELNNPGTEYDLLENKELIDQEGNRIVGNIPARSDNDLSVNGPTISIPKGYYDNQIDKSIESVDQAIPNISVDSAGKITASATQTAGYVAAGTKSATKQLTTKAATTITPSTSSQTAVGSGVYTTGDIKVAAMPTATQATPSISVDSAGKITASATQTAGYVAAGTKSTTKQLTVQAAQTITPGTSNKTIASGTYLTGTQTIAGDADLKAANIKKGVNIFGIAGSYDAVELNFAVVGGTTQPTNPTENMIWVNTSTTITNWKFSAKQPENMSNGEVWIKIGIDSDAAFDIVDGVKIHPISVKHYINGTWVDKVAKSYQNGKWVGWFTLNDFVKNGILNPNVNLNGKLRSGQSFKIEQKDGYVRVNSTSSISGGIATTTKYNVGNFSKITLKCNVITIAANTDGNIKGCRVGLVNGLSASDVYNAITGNFVASTTTNKKGEQVIECDISNVSGNYYPAISFNVSTSIYPDINIYDFYLS